MYKAHRSDPEQCGEHLMDCLRKMFLLIKLNTVNLKGLMHIQHSSASSPKLSLQPSGYSRF